MIDELVKSVSEKFMPAVIIVAILMPFWYISIYLFHRDLYEKSSQVLKWVFSFCFSFSWFVFLVFCILFVMGADLGKPNTSAQPFIPLLHGSVEDLYFTSGFVAFGSVSLPIVILYQLHKNKSRNFIDFLKTVILTGIMILVGLIALRLLKAV